LTESFSPFVVAAFFFLLYRPDPVDPMGEKQVFALD
jgi:hypothetical protein